MRRRRKVDRQVMRFSHHRPFSGTNKLHRHIFVRLLHGLDQAHRRIFVSAASDESISSQYLLARPEPSSRAGRAGTRFILSVLAIRQKKIVTPLSCGGRGLGFLPYLGSFWRGTLFWAFLVLGLEVMPPI